MTGHARRNLIKLMAAAPRPCPWGWPDDRQWRQAWPLPRVRLLVGTSPGGSPDVVGQMLAEWPDRPAWRSAVYVENVTQAAGAVAYRTLARAAPDGGTMGVLTAGYAFGSDAAPGPKLRSDFGLSPSWSMLCAYPLVYAVPVNSPIRSFRDLLDRVKQNPGEADLHDNGLRFGLSYDDEMDRTRIRSGR